MRSSAERIECPKSGSVRQQVKFSTFSSPQWFHVSQFRVRERPGLLRLQAAFLRLPVSRTASDRLTLPRNDDGGRVMPVRSGLF